MKKYIEIEEELEKLEHAFPESLRSDIKSLVSMINAKSKHSAHWGYKMHLDNQQIEIPTRIYWDESKLTLNALTDTGKLILACILTRHHNGYVREANLEKLVSSEKYWTIPYVIQLLGEYVIELLELIWEKFDKLHKENLIGFIHENESYWFKTKQRISSYWDCYHKYKGNPKSEYVGFKLIERIEKLGGRKTRLDPG